MPILQLAHLEELVLVGCLGIDDDGLAFLNEGCSTLKVCNFLQITFRSFYLYDNI